MADGFPQSVGIIGAGAMGAGIAQVASGAGWKVLLRDVDAAVCRRAIDGIVTQFDRLVEKGRLTRADRDAAVGRLRIAADAADFARCDLIIEAIIENLDIKTRVLRDLTPSLRPDCIIATNTSSLSVTAIGDALGEPFRGRIRTVGMHFFNPAPVMKLVEVIAGAHTDPAVVDRVAAIAESWGKVVARAADVPGFIVNHIARPYYLEAFRILEDGLALPGEIDDAMKSLGGFRMGPLQLTDLIGQDVNAATTRSVWEQLGRPPLLAPSRLQEQLVKEGRLGRKTKRGVYDYAAEPPAPAIARPGSAASIPDSLREAAREFALAAMAAAPPGPQPTAHSAQPYVFARILAGIIVQAHLAFERGVATKIDIDTAMKFGVNYPRGPFEWTAQIGAVVVTRWLHALNSTVGNNRFAPPKSLEE
jgi:3-hydroxybutyryl-CoA dehydrogenase